MRPHVQTGGDDVDQVSTWARAGPIGPSSRLLATRFICQNLGPRICHDKEIFASLASWSMCLVDGAKWSCPESRISPFLQQVASLYVIETPPWGGVSRERQNDPIASLSSLATLVNDYSAKVEVVNADFPWAWRRRCGGEALSNGRGGSQLRTAQLVKTKSTQPN